MDSTAKPMRRPPKMHRIMISLPEPTIRFLRDASKARGTSMAEIVRTSIDFWRSLQIPLGDLHDSTEAPAKDQ